MLRCPNGRYFGYNRRGVIFAFKSRRHAEYIKSHVKYDGNHVERIVANKYRIKTPYNTENSFQDSNPLDKDDLELERRKLYDLVLSCNVNRVSLRIVNTILDLDDGDLELNVDFIKYRMLIDDEITRFNLEMMYYQ
jgi:hypothetical protein